MDEKKNEPRTPSRGEINKIYTENALRQDAKIREEQRKHAKDNWQGRTR